MKELEQPIDWVRPKVTEDLPADIEFFNAGNLSEWHARVAMAEQDESWRSELFYPHGYPKTRPKGKQRIHPVMERQRNRQEPSSPIRPLVCSVATAKSILRHFKRGRLTKLPSMVLPARLSPIWTCQLMGMTSEKTFFVHLETPCMKTPQNSPSER